MKKTALISVTDKSGIVEFANELSQLGFSILSTGGTFKVLQDSGVEVGSVETYTGQKEILDGRVKTLHPKIHAGILANRADAAHLEQLKTDGIDPIDLLVVNLYPFEAGLKAEVPLAEAKMVELIDVGGPSMIRGAAKNFSGVMTLIDPADYQPALEFLTQAGFASEAGLEFRRSRAAKAFARLADYNSRIAEYLSEQAITAPNYKGFIGELKQELRYGENPHQTASFFKPFGKEISWSQLNGKELSYNNLLDLDSGLRILKTFKEDIPTVAILKHLNPCGAAQAKTYELAYQSAKLTDPRSHFGGVVITNGAVDKIFAELIVEDFKEIVVAPQYSDEALKILKAKKNLRVIQANLEPEDPLEFRSACEGMLVQQPDTQISNLNDVSWASGIAPSEDQLKDLKFAWKVCASVKSNAIVLVKNSALIGVGAGQMSRIDSTEVALANAAKHGHNIQGSVAASDAFFPFTDNIETLAEAGVSAVIAPSGAKKDEAVVEVAKKLGIVFGFTNNRHFRH
ncbi:MAG: bifunctional phosphoribosylaminoimidazolecarboxamide formyltransferase/IMP cyclohydrolase [Bdellovibrionota bacterium]